MSRTRFDSVKAILDNSPFRKARVRGLNKDSTVYVVYPYGITANAPLGSLCVSWQIGGQESDRFAITDFPQIRPKDLKPGEVVVSNYLTKSEVRFKANGDIEITSAAKVNVIAATDLNLTAIENLTLNAVNIEITGALTNNGTNVGSTHIHSQGNDSDGDSEVDTGTPHS